MICIAALVGAGAVLLSNLRVPRLHDFGILQLLQVLIVTVVVEIVFKGRNHSGGRISVAPARGTLHHRLLRMARIDMLIGVRLLRREARRDVLEEKRVMIINEHFMRLRLNRLSLLLSNE